MLAPRKKLWSTPFEVVDEAIRLLNINESDIVFDIGAGDGRFLIRCAIQTNALNIGVEIDEERASEAKENCSSSSVSSLCSVLCGNALEQDYSTGTVFFLYLVPRGLRLILPLLQNIQHPIRVVTYMSSFPEKIVPTRICKVKTQQHGEAEWPLYLYHFDFINDP
eukprot:gene9977-20745_t